MRRGYGVRMKRRLRIFALAAVCAGIVVLSGCAPADEPTPTPTAAFASDEEAFAAAEETYRAYVDALNQVDLSDPDTFEPVYAWTTGEVNATEREQLTNAHADGWTVDGDTEIVAVETLRYAQGKEIAIVVCIDVSKVVLIDADGTSRVSPDRADRASRVVTLLPGPTTTRWAIAGLEPSKEDLCSP